MNLKHFLPCLACSVLQLWGFDLVTDGKPNAIVYVSKDALPAEKIAAQELISYVKQMTGATLPLTHQLPATGNRILLGTDQAVQRTMPNVAFKKLKFDEIILDTPDASTLVLSGDRPRGTLYATYTLLEDWGVRFWAPYYETVPNHRTLCVKGKHIRYASPFDFRQPFSETTMSHPDWNAKMKVNGHIWMTPIPETLGGSRQMDMRQSLTNNYVKPKEFFAKHPEWYAWNAKTKQRMPKQLCMTNTGALDQLVKEVRRDLKADSTREFISVALPDNNACCQCDTCSEIMRREGAFSALSIYAANYVGRAIAKEFPKVKVVILAYWPTERPPKSIQMEKNCGVIFAMLDRNYGTPVNATPRHNPFLKKWQELSHGTVYVYDYWATYGNFLLPMPGHFNQGDNIRTYRNYQVRGIFSQLPFGSLAEFVDLRSWISARLYWNPDQDDRQLTKEYLKGMYGQAAPYLLQYLDLLEEAVNRNRGTWIGVYVEETSHWLTAQDILAGRKLMLQALEATKGTVYHSHVERVSASSLLVIALRYEEVAREAKRNGQPLPGYKDIVDRMEQLGKTYKCDNYREWADYSVLIKRLRKNTPAFSAPKSQNQVRHLDPNDFTGKSFTIVNPNTADAFARLAVDSVALKFPWMDLDKGSIVYEIPPDLEGHWKVTMTLRVSATQDFQTAAAYYGIYRLQKSGKSGVVEVFRQAISRSRGDLGWETVSLGDYYLTPKTKIWVMPGIIAPVNFIDVKDITLTPVQKN